MPAPAKPSPSKLQIALLLWILLLVSMPAFIQAFAGTPALRDEGTPLLSKAIHLPFALGILLIAWALVGSRLALWASIPLGILAQLEIFNIFVMGKPSSIGTINALLDTTPREARELLDGVWPLVALSLALLVAHFAIVWFARRSLGRTPLRFRLPVLAVAFCLLAPEAVYIATRPLASPWKILSLRLDAEDTFPFGALHKSASVLMAKYRLIRRPHAVRTFDWKPRRTGPSTLPETYVLIIGEASRAGDWSLYGSDNQTTPLLAAEPDLFVFRDMTAGSNETPESVPMFLTLATPEQPGKFDSSLSVVSCFRQAGFKTWWLSTQGRFGVYDSKPALIGKEADEWTFPAVDPDVDEAIHDGNLLPPLDKALRDTSSRKLIVLHTLGSHFQYAKRYPKSFERFPVSDRSPRDSGSYFNALLYTDWILEQVLSRIRATSGIRAMLYLADHGESRGENGHFLHCNEAPPRAEFEVPFLVWTSPELDRIRPEIVTQLRVHLDAKASAPDFLPTFLDIADIHSPWIDSNRSLGSNGYRPRIRLARLPQGTLTDVDTLTGSSFREPRHPSAHSTLIGLGK